MPRMFLDNLEKNTIKKGDERGLSKMGNFEYDEGNMVVSYNSCKKETNSVKYSNGSLSSSKSSYSSTGSELIKDLKKLYIIEEKDRISSESNQQQSEGNSALRCGKSPDLSSYSDCGSSYLNEKFIPKINDDKIKVEDYKDDKIMAYLLYKYPSFLQEKDLLILLDSRDKYIKYKSCSILTKQYSEKQHKEEYIVFLKKHLLETSCYEELNQILIFIIDFLSVKSCKKFDLVERKRIFCTNKYFVDALRKILHVKEVQYNVVMIIYIISYEETLLPFIINYINDLMIIIRERTREKILRVSFGTILNILKHTELSINHIYELRKVTDMLNGSDFSDHELIEYIKKTDALLKEQHSKYDIKKYLEELFTGNYQDSDFHYNTDFWTKNLPTIKTNRVEIVKVLKKYLKSHNTNWVYMASNDIYMLVKVYPEIIEILNKYHVKDVLFELTKSDNDDIRYSAIQTLYLCIFSEWS